MCSVRRVLSSGNFQCFGGTTVVLFRVLSPSMKCRKSNECFIQISIYDPTSGSAVARTWTLCLGSFREICELVKVHSVIWARHGLFSQFPQCNDGRLMCKTVGRYINLYRYLIANKSVYRRFVLKVTKSSNHLFYCILLLRPPHISYDNTNINRPNRN